MQPLREGSHVHNLPQEGHDGPEIPRATRAAQAADGVSHIGHKSRGEEALEMDLQDDRPKRNENQVRVAKDPKAQRTSHVAVAKGMDTLQWACLQQS